MLVFIILLAAIVLWIDLENISRPDWTKNFLFWRSNENRDIKIVQGLDLQGGLEVLLQAVPAPSQQISADLMQAARRIIEQRINGLGVSEPLVQAVGGDRIAVQLPGVQDPDLAIRTFGETGLLEFVDVGSFQLFGGEVLSTTGFLTASIAGPVIPTTTPTISPTPTVTLSPTTSATPTREVTPTTSITTTSEITPTTPVTPTKPALGPFRTVMTGVHLESARVEADPQTGLPAISFKLTPEGAQIFAEHTRNNVGKFLAITMDKQVLSSPRIQGPILGGNGQITGQFSPDEAQALVVQLKYGSLPIPLKVISSRTVGPTLGQDSINRSYVAGAIGISMVILFMLLYYRLPGFLADLALLLYGGLVLAIFKLIPVTLTLAGIAGFILSIGLAVDANILIFERMKEELRAGRSLRAAIRAGFDRAWPSIRDSNASSLITCAILFWFGANFGASIVAGFALTLAIGIVMSLFTAIVVTRNLLNLIVDLNVTHNMWWFGVSQSSEQ
jgi:preprotein translocase subunit SecD